jgi:hypothetical protein
MEYKTFEQVQIGDTATDYGGFDYKVVGKGTLAEMFNQFGYKCPLGLSDYEDNTPDELSVAVQHPDGDVLIYLYEPDGAAVYIKN